MLQNCLTFQRFKRIKIFKIFYNGGTSNIALAHPFFLDSRDSIKTQPSSGAEPAVDDERDDAAERAAESEDVGVSSNAPGPSAGRF